MKRVQLFEFEDFQWFPTTFRSTMTKLISVFHRLLGTKELLANLLLKIKDRHSFQRVVDMGSGSGGIMPEVVEHLHAQGHPINVLLTDLHPNSTFVKHFNQQDLPNIRYREQALDATDLSQAPEGVKTMVNSFHHMPPPVAKKILATAQANRQPILIYEIAENKAPLLLWWLLLPISLPITALMAVVMVPFVKPLRWQDLVFTWLIPLVPIFYAWDGQASAPRMYTFRDIEEHLLPPPKDGYTWEMAPAPKPNGKTLGYYILGLPA